jgi:hypothetical protein
MDDSIGRLDKFNQNAITGNGGCVIALGVNEGHVVTGSSSSDAAWCKADTLARHPFYGFWQMVYP